MTPKSLLRHPRAASSLRDLSEGTFQPVLDDPRPADRKPDVTRLLLCSGKVYVDLVYGGLKFEIRPEYTNGATVAIARVEQLYPFPADELTALLATYPHVREVVWVQEEPRNMGAWTFLAPRLANLLAGGVKLTYTGRPEAASPSEGKKTSHDREQARIVAEAYGTSSLPSVAPAPTGGDGVSVKEAAASESVITNNKNRNGAYTNGTGAKTKPSVTQVTSESTEQRTEA